MIRLSTFDSTATSPSEEPYWRLIETIDTPLSKTGIKSLYTVLKFINSEKVSHIPKTIINKLMKLSKCTIDMYEKSVKSKNANRLSLLKLVQHFQLIHQKKSSANRSIVYACYICDKLFQSKEYLKSHINRRHQSNLVKSLSSSLTSQLQTIELNSPRSSIPSLNLAEEISRLREQQRQIKAQLEEKLKQLEEESPSESIQIKKSSCNSKQWDTIEEEEYKNFIKEISSRPVSPPPEEVIRKPQDLLLAAHALGIDPVVDSHYLYIAKQFLDKPLPKEWKIQGNRFQNTLTGEVETLHPGINHYKALVSIMKHKKETLMQKIKELLNPSCKVLKNKYKRGVKTSFGILNTDFSQKRGEMANKLEEQIARLGKITMKKLLQIEKETTKCLSSDSEYRRCANKVLSEINSLSVCYE